MTGQRLMRLFFLTSCIVFALAGCAPQAGKTSPPLTAEQVTRAGIDHQADINRVLDLMSSPDLNVRASGIGQALAYTQDRNLRQLALSMAFVSSDPSLRNRALLGAIATSESLLIRLVGSTTKSHYLFDRIDDNILVYISHNTNNYSEFTTRTAYSVTKTDSSGKKIYMVSPGVINGNTIRFGLDLTEAGASECVVSLILLPVGSAMHGTLTCKNNEGYAIASSALN